MSPFTLGHSRAVAALAAEAARHCRLSAADVELVYNAGLVHDVGRAGVSASIWNAPRALSNAEWERVRLHPYFTERVLARPFGLAQISRIASFDHERLDGSGYHRAVPAVLQNPTVRLLAASDAYQALTEPRPHRPAYAPDQAADELRREVRAGRLDGEAVDAVLAAAGHRMRRKRPDRWLGSVNAKSRFCAFWLGVSRTARWRGDW